jgi:hypothetical protein
MGKQTPLDITQVGDFLSDRHEKACLPLADARENNFVAIVSVV